MNKTWKRLGAALLSVSMLWSAVPTFALEKTQEDEIKVMMDSFVTQMGITSVQYALMEGGTVISTGSAGFTDVEKTKTPTADTMYGIASVSKLFTTAAAMQLVEDGKLDLDKPITTYLPSFKMKDERYKQITPRTLLNHSSGLYGMYATNVLLYGDNDTYNHDTFLEHLSTQRLKAAPGAFSVYCNDGFTLMEIVIEAISGKTFTGYITENITEPLGLIHTQTPQNLKVDAKLAVTYSPILGLPTPIDYLNAIGTGGIYSTAAELCEIGDMLMGNAPAILSKTSVEAMQQHEYRNGTWPVAEKNSFNFGLGWDSVALYPFTDYGIKAMTKGGDTSQFHSSLTVVPEHSLTVAVVSSGGASSLNTVLGNAILLKQLQAKNIIGDLLPEPEIKAPVQVPMDKSLEAYSGIYGASNVTVHIEVKDGKLTIPSFAEGMPDQEIIHTGGGVFTSTDGGSKFFFEKGKNGETYLAQEQWSTLPGMGSYLLNVYNVQKLEKNVISEELQALWKGRISGKAYIVSEKPTSQLLASAAAGTFIDNTENGYIGSCKIIDENTAVNAVQLPGILGRDSTDMEFFVKDGKDYINANATYILANSIQNLHNGKSSVSTIQADGYTRWYTLGEEMEGKTITATTAGKGAFFVYNADGYCLYATTVSGGKQTKLPKGGSIAFAGGVGEKFSISIA